MDSLYDDADLYDLVAPRDDEMERFYVEAAGGPGRTVLELACGSGRITAPLARSGAEVTGVDISATMLDRARAVLAGSAAELVEADMRELDLGRRFDTVVVAANSLLHLHTREDFVRAFSAVRRHLASGGRLAFDIFVPSPRLLSLRQNERQLLGVFGHPERGEVAIEETIAYDPITQVSRADWYWSTAAAPDFRHTQLEMRQVFPQELPLLLELGGLRLEARYGGFDRSPLTPQSRRQVCVAVAA
ncbi:class I SAM-dependent methyltransferase [Devosia sp. CN2-171]|uniref:class I SAM-dependent methyltransferase n=1 Tax=Devosia sp. CN2-171 TaxID=3400909 RepID=UPI003BF7DA3A